MLNESFVLIMAYLIGSIPMGLIIVFCAGYGDIRKIGSGNIGATNALRASNKFVALLTLAADTLKIIIAIILANKISDYNDYLVGCVAILGHIFPVWLNFKGGKGVACFFGLSIYLFPMVATVMLVTWVAIFAITRFSSLAAIIAALAGAVALLITQVFDLNMILILAIIVIILIRHKDNILRLRNGTEPKFGS